MDTDLLITRLPLGGGGGGIISFDFRLSQHLSILIFYSKEPQKLDRQKCISMESSFHRFFKDKTIRLYLSARNK